MIRFVVDETTEPTGPLHGPPCPGVASHRWTLSVEEGDISLRSGCDECDAIWEPHYVEMGELPGRLSWEHDHEPGRCPNALRFLPCDCNVWLQFTPEAGQ